MPRPDLKDHSRYILSRLRHEDASAEAMISWLQAGVMAFLGLVYFVSKEASAPGDTIHPVTVVLLTLAPTIILRLIMTRRRVIDRVLVHFFILLDALFLCALILTTHLEFDNLNETYLNASTFSYFFLLLSLRSLRYEKQFVIMSGAWTLLFYVGFGAYAISSNDLSLPQSYLEATFNMITSEFDKLMAIGLVTFVLTLGVHRSRRLLISSVREVTTAHTLLKVKHTELLKAKELAELAIKSKDSFLSIMGHELKTPLNAVIGFAELIKQEANSMDHKQYLDDAEKIKLSGERLLFLIERMLILSMKDDFVRITPNKKPIKIDQMMNHLVRVSESMNRSNVDFIYENRSGIDSITTDIEILKKITYELLHNAVQFNDGRARVEILFELATENEQRFLRINFIDNGWGIPKEEIEQVFELFYQVEHYSTRSINGAGVGLSLCKQLCKELDVEMRAKSILNKGSEFTLYIPLQKENRAGLSIVGEPKDAKA